LLILGRDTFKSHRDQSSCPLHGDEIEEDNLKFLDDPEIIERILEYTWPGNVRELKSEIKRWINLNGKGEELRFLPGEFSEDGLKENSSLCDQLEQYERKLILKALKENNWVITKTARSMNVPEATLHFKIKKFNISRSESSSS